MLALKSTDAAADHAAFSAAGFAGGEPLSFRRKAVSADGAEREIGVDLAFAASPSAPDATFLACRHLAPDALYDPKFLAHANGATGVTWVVAVADRPDEFSGLLAATARGAEEDVAPVKVMAAEAFSDRYGLAPPEPRGGLRFAAIEMAVADLDAAAAHAGAAARRRGERLIVGPGPGLGAALAFEAADG